MNILTGKYYPDYCSGSLFGLTPKVGLMLAVAAREIYHQKFNHDIYVGLLVERIPHIQLKSLAPVISSHIWDGFLSYCPFLCFTRFCINPLVLGAGSANDDIQYVHNPTFFACITIEHVNSRYLKPVGLFINIFNKICTRN